MVVRSVVGRRLRRASWLFDRLSDDVCGALHGCSIGCRTTFAARFMVVRSVVGRRSAIVELTTTVVDGTHSTVDIAMANIDSSTTTATATATAAAIVVTPRLQPSIFFKGPRSPLSNLYPCRRLPAYGTTFASLEHAYQYRQAIHYGDTVAARMTRGAPDGYAAKRLSRCVMYWSASSSSASSTSSASSAKRTIDWKRKRLAVMRGLLRAKLSVCPELRAALASSGGATLVENVPSRDGFWGRGLRSTGCTNLGKLLMELRDRPTPTPMTVQPEQSNASNASLH